VFGTGRVIGAKLAIFTLALCSLAGCASSNNASLPPAPLVAAVPQAEDYKIGQGDVIQVTVWRSPELSVTAPVRPDGKISTPLAGEVQAAGLTSTELAQSITQKLQPYLVNAVVSVIVSKYGDVASGQVRAIGEVNKPIAVPYRDQMTVLDVLIEVGGMTRFANGNNAVLVREANGVKTSYHLRLDDLVARGDITANAAVLPGDVIIVPR
jgi:polysaccharide export outer membrane protein